MPPRRGSPHLTGCGCLLVRGTQGHCGHCPSSCWLKFCPQRREGLPKQGRGFAGLNSLTVRQFLCAGQKAASFLLPPVCSQVPVIVKRPKQALSLKKKKN